MDKMKSWVAQIADTVPGFLESLAGRSNFGKFRPCLNGVTRIGQEASLGFSCFALKLYFILGLWEHLDLSKQNQWAGFIKSFQEPKFEVNGKLLENSFVDRILINQAYDYSRYPLQMIYHLSIQLRSRNDWFHKKSIRQNLTNPIIVIDAETKQAIATLSEIGVSPDSQYGEFPQSPDMVLEALTRLNWRKPWAAGGRAASMAVFIASQLHLLSDEIALDDLKAAYNRFFESIVDPRTGAYFQGEIPDYGQAVNGAMKVLTGLDWFQIPIHYPEKLIDTCLSRLPSPEGCHLVDTVYVLYQCHRISDHRKQEVISYLNDLVGMIKKHYNNDGGFSYFIDRSQTSYYNIRISSGKPGSDIHGTLLLTWAMAMILEIIDQNEIGWRVLKP